MALGAVEYPKETVHDEMKWPGVPILEREAIDYERLSETVNQVVVNSLKEITKREGLETRQHIDKVKEDIIKKVQEGNLTIVDCLRYNSTQNIHLLSLTGALVAASSLLISGLIKFNIINPFVAAIMAVASLGFFIMTKFELRKKE
jgi:predicted DNA-binding ribbon-helix-helix protein